MKDLLKITTLIGPRCTYSNIFSRGVLIDQKPFMIFVVLFGCKGAYPDLLDCGHNMIKSCLCGYT